MDELERQRILSLLERQCFALDRLIDQLAGALAAHPPAPIGHWDGVASLAFDAVREQLRGNLARAGERLHDAKHHSRRAVLTLSDHVG